jgi:glyoxylase-like metal-dependent hydrolase (beta-lactamase superfamily II)
MESGGWEIELVDTGMVPIEAERMGPPGTFTETYEGPVNVLVLRGHGLTVLVDAGSGPLITIWPGAANKPFDVEPDLLIATHLDWDHFGGFVTGTWPDELEPAFPGKRVLAPEEAVADARAGGGDDERTAPRIVAALGGLVEEYVDGAGPASGLRLRRAPGHRIGHSILDVGDSFVYATDVFQHPLHVEHPEWDTAFDEDPELGLETRRALLAELADGGATVAVAHIAEPGRIERAGDGFCWVEL